MPLHLTQGERIMLGRRREGLTQAELADAENVTQSLVSRWEADEAEPPNNIVDKYKKLGTLTDFERALIMRRRLGITMGDMARQLHCSRYHLIKMESGRARAENYYKHMKEKYANEKPHA